MKQGSARMRRTIIAISAATALAAGTPAVAGNKGWDDASSIGRDVLVGAALSVPALHGDWHGVLQAGGSMGAATLVSTGLKESFPELRPDGSDRKSFPSGHTSISFAAAATLQNRYGWQVGVPAQLVAAFVGVARVKADRHHWYDVAAGAAIGEAAGFLITNRHSNRVQVFPWGDTKGGGVAMAMRF
jgi:membrane-associated phospholipid phosphatase